MYYHDKLCISNLNSGAYFQIFSIWSHRIDSFVEQTKKFYKIYLCMYNVCTFFTCMQLDPPPAYIQSRIEMFDRLKAEYDAMLAAKESSPIKVTLPDGKEVEGKSWKTTPLEIATSIR